MGLLSLVWCAVLCGCQTGQRSSSESVPEGTPAFELRLASAQAMAGWKEMPVRGGGTLLVCPQPLLTPSQISKAAFGKNDGDSLILNVREGSRGTLQAISGEHMKKPIVFLIDGQAVYMAVLGMPLSRQVSIRVGPDGITEAEAKYCLQAVKDAGR